MADSTRIAGPLIVVDGTGDGGNEVYFNTTEGHLFGITVGGKPVEFTPYRWGDRGQPGMTVGSGVSVDEDDRVLWLVSPGGIAGPPLDRQFINGRIMGYQLDATADESNRTSEWLGSGGGPLRTGPIGAVQSIEIAGLTPAAETGVFFYPNPLRDDMVTLRFFAPAVGKARFFLHNLEGEEILQSEFQVDAGLVNEQQIDLAHVVSGMYMGRLVYPVGSGFETKILTLAIER